MSSVACYYRALFHYTEAALLLPKGFLIPTLSALYYSYFHLGTAHLLAELTPPQKLGKVEGWVENVREKIAEGEDAVSVVEHGWVWKVREKIAKGEDAASAVEHGWVRDYLKERSGDGQLVGLNSAVWALWYARNDLHYGPRLRKVSERTYHFDTCSYEPHEVCAILKEHLNLGSEYFAEFCASCDLRVLRFLDSHAGFFLEDPTGLSPYFLSEARQAAATLHRQLQQQVEKRVEACAVAARDSDGSPPNTAG